MARMRFVLAGIICLVLAAGSGGLALARVQPLLSGVIEICAGDRITTLRAEPDTPAQAPHPCPDCVIAGLSILPETFRLPPAPARAAPPGSTARTAVAEHAPPLRSARDPPVAPC